MTLIRRILLLTVVSLSGIALLAPLAARSAAPATAPFTDILLTIPDAPTVLADRGTLTGRGASASVTSLAGTEEIESGTLPTPPSAAMAATIHVIATPPPTPAPQRVVTYAGDTVWDRLAQCESGGNWAIVSQPTGKYMGGLQFDYQTWHAYGGGEFAEYPHHATREQQIAVAERLRAARGYHPWPACSKKLGLT